MSGKDVFLSTSKVELKGLRCPKCNADCGGWTGMSFDNFPQPEPGSLTLCGECGIMLFFVESFTTYRSLSLRPATQAEIETIRMDPRLKTLWESAVRLRKAYHKGPKKNYG